MGNTELRFLYELLMKREEIPLYQSVLEDPCDDARRKVYADYLEEQGRMESAAIIRSGPLIPGYGYVLSSGPLPISPVPSGYVYPVFPSGYQYAPGPCGSIAMTPISNIRSSIQSGYGRGYAYAASGTTIIF